MLYIILTVTFVLVVMNAYASYVVLQSTRNEKGQKVMQIFFVWLLPFIGSVVTTHLLKERLQRPVTSRSWIDSSDGRAWNNDSGEGTHYEPD